MGVVCSFFSGIGGFDIGFERAGFRTALQSEIDRNCVKVLRRGWPGITLVGDVSSIDVATIPQADVWCAGFPCQDCSLARGAVREGLRGARTGLFFAFSSLVSAAPPDTVVLENVPGLLSSNSGEDFRTVLTTLARCGYEVAWRILNSRWFGVPQSRSRVFLVARRRNAAGGLFEPVAPAMVSDRDGALREPDISGSVVVPRISYCLAATSGRHTGTDWSRTYVVDGGRARRMTPEECEAIQGFPEGWTSGLEGGMDAPRYHTCGNAVSVPVAEWIASRLLADDVPDLDVHGFGDAAPQSESKFNKWPKAGLWADGVCRVAPECPTAPSSPVQSRLVDCVRAGADERFFISANAAAGMLRRADSAKRSLFPPLRLALEKIVT